MSAEEEGKRGSESSQPRSNELIIT
jgi:hypothetical protein